MARTDLRSVNLDNLGGNSFLGVNFSGCISNKCLDRGFEIVTRAQSLPFRPQLMPEPGRLPLGILPGRDLGAFDRLGKTGLPGHRALQLTNADRLHRRQVRIETKGRKLPDFLQRTFVQHLVETPFDAIDQHGPVRLDDQEMRRLPVDERPAALGLPFQDRSAGCVEHLERAHDALAVGGLQLHGGSRILAQQDAMQLDRSPFLQLVAPTVAHLLGNIRHVRNALCQRAEVKPCAADEDRPPRERAVIDQLRDVAQPCSRRVGGAGMDMPIEKMRRPCEVGCLRPGGQHVENRIALHGIGVDDDATRAFGHVERQCRLAAGGRPGYQDRVRHAALARTCAGILDAAHCHACFPSR
ncbi:hypothetical protein X742_10250 [Mesorhizobium sp. LNHC232B00]|nr:hypothetical protein X742_10250 [Mesorhizobium sp. LNHC232B00]